MGFKVLTIIGTRPEAIKMSPILKQLEADAYFESKLCLTGQHLQMMDSVLTLFGIVPDYTLNTMTDNQDLSTLTSKILTGLTDVFRDYQPTLVLVHGDTTSTLVGALAAYYHRVPLGHIEAGLRTGNLLSPWPEEANRQLTSVLTQLHFAPTERARQNLLNEGVADDRIHVTGNTVIDALFSMINQLDSDKARQLHLQKTFHYLNPNRKLILVTGHRRENFGEGFKQICYALATIAKNHPNVDIVYPVHLNPNVQQPVKSLLGHIKTIHLIDPVDYVACTYLMKLSYLILTDSGGIQEEAPSLGKPVLVMRDTTERPEALETGAIKLVGTDVSRIVSHVDELLSNKETYMAMSHTTSPYGDGQSAKKIIQVIRDFSKK